MDIETSHGGRLVFDAVGKFGRDVLMKGTLKNMGMNDVSGLFYVNDNSDLEGWPPKVKLMTKKSYMQGYYKLDPPFCLSIRRCHPLFFISLPIAIFSCESNICLVL